MELNTDAGYRHLLEQISETYTRGRVQAVQAVNAHITQTYWQVGRQIVEFEQGGKSKAEYGKALITNLARDLGLRHGKGFSRTNLVYMRLFYQQYPDAPIGQTLSDQLGWSHLVELLKIDDPLERGFYAQQIARERWSVRELVRQKESALFLRCFVLVDLKITDVQHHDIGQMNLYLGYFANEESGEGDNPPIGIILSRNKDELLVEYATYGMNSQLFVQKYQLYLPDREALHRELELSLREAKP